MNKLVCQKGLDKFLFFWSFFLLIEYWNQFWFLGYFLCWLGWLTFGVCLNEFDFIVLPQIWKLSILLLFCLDFAPETLNTPQTCDIIVCSQLVGDSVLDVEYRDWNTSNQTNSVTHFTSSSLITSHSNNNCSIVRHWIENKKKVTMFLQSINYVYKF